MGIPSFYKHLIQTITGVVSKTRAPPAVFALDLNCAIYHCVRRVQKRTAYHPDSRSIWEGDLIREVITYVQQMERVVKPSETLYIAVDGVAPMAKIKQQRMRRFKSAVVAEEESRIRAEARNETYIPQPRWDTNAITPGTQFMSALATALRTFARTMPSKILVSPADEPGEGEQKIMEYVRKHTPTDVVVYGLDADLIVLSLWASATTPTRIDLFREEVEFNGAIKTNPYDEEQFLYMNIEHLATALFNKYSRGIDQPQTQFITDFVALMSLLGNDFVPHGMTLKIKDDGVPKTLGYYRDALTQPLLLLRSEEDGNNTWRYNPAALKELFALFAAEEPTALLQSVSKKLEARVGATAGKSAEEKALAAYNDLPVAWAEDECLIDRVRLPTHEYPQKVLKPGWRDVYDEKALFGASPAQASSAYLDALAWTLAYYSGEKVDLRWYYPWFLPPRHESILAALKTATLEPPLCKPREAPITPHEQLAMVLPQTSFHMLPSEYAKLPGRRAHVFPKQWGVYSFGRRFLWECEPLIPLIQPSQIKEWMEELYETA